MKRPKRVPKPKYIKLGKVFDFDTFIVEDEEMNYGMGPIVIGDYDLSIKEAKRLHSWLSKAIAYIEQEGKKCFSS